MIIAIDTAIPSNFKLEREILLNLSDKGVDLSSSTGIPSIIVNFRTEQHYSGLCIVDS
jgi:hypothetical protein